MREKEKRKCERESYDKTKERYETEMLEKET